MTKEEFKNTILPQCRKLYPIIFRIIKDEEETRDALQDVIVKLWNKRNELKDCSNQTAYVITVAKNYGLDMLKKKKPLRIGEKEEHKLNNLKCEGLTPETKERFECVRKVMENLPDKYKTVIQLRDIDGFSFDEMKEITGYEVPNLRVMLSRARLKVKQEVEKIYDYDRTKEFTQQIL